MNSSTIGIQAACDTALGQLQQGRLDEAEACCASILQQAPGQYRALAILALAKMQRGQPAEALRHVEQALAIESDQAEAQVTRGNALHRLGRYAEAVQAYQAALALKPDAYDALANCGISWSRLGQPEQALHCYDAALELCPNSADAHYNRGLLQFRMQRYALALSDFDAVLRHADDAETQAWRSYSLCYLQRHEEALRAGEQAVRLAPASAPAWRAQAYVLMALGRHDAAIDAYRSAIALRAAGDADAGLDHYHRALALTRLGENEAALADFELALAFNPAPDHALGDRLMAAMRTAHWDDFEQYRTAICDGIARGLHTASPFAVATFADEPGLIRRAGELFIERLGLQPPLPAPAAKRHERLRLGYFSADFHAHATTLLMFELFEQHDRAHFEVFLFAFGPVPPDDMTTRLSAAVEHFIDVRHLSDAAICTLARQLGIDIAVDLKGYTQDCRVGIFALRAAPIQVSYLGYPGSMGARFIDYLIGDGIVTPPAQQPHYAEQIVCLPHCYQPNSASMRPLPPAVADRRAARQAAGLPEQGFVFCCFNNTYKITPELFALWMRLLHAVGDSALWLYEPDAEAASRLRTHAAAHAVAPARLVFATRLALPDHLARHALADLFLDTLPYNAHTTGSDALWAGLPVLSCLGATFPGRVGASLLQAVGLPELIVDSLPAYEAKAVQLANDPGLLENLRERLWQARTDMPLFDADRYRRHLEAAYLHMWRRHCRGEPVEAFAVPASPS